ncbi:multicomponent Na+:H+ antiporter subunit B [Geoalkalibacter ferrihydriticus]|uniref:Multicomponent Na+:H+ antiporter subunit B n=1 Tax=Geoalkalibacter ferrihydriticus TaxID=392333 RepID=A0A1G9MS44_9BACT|nr:hydrogen gas-evolving membrane-bound hydrogenase subunit E [Geoalkalibacter ferrihydriticus]SDL77060.1 multicomponent Na+:H+ antiporter subunit B [Geoalkalibacter ferrihydriticus]
MKLLALAATLLTGAILLYGTADFPAWGDPESPANTHVSAGYIETAVQATHTPNLVTAVLGDYRAYDTMFELVVIYCAGIGVIGVLRRVRE